MKEINAENFGSQLMGNFECLIHITSQNNMVFFLCKDEEKKGLA
jgi:hypothetical protein